MVWTPRQTGAFLDHAASDRLSALLETVAATGMRRAEVCGLPRADVNLANGVITVRATRIAMGRTVHEDTPKSDAGRRDIALDQRMSAVLRGYFGRQAAEHLAWGEAWAGSGLAFTREDGSPVHPNTVSERFQRLAYDAGLPPVTLHSLRHGAATYALAAGVDVKLVQERLGHSTRTLTRDTYTSVLPDVARAAAEAAAAMIPGADSGPDGPPSDSYAPVAAAAALRVGRKGQVRATNNSGAGGARTHDRRIMSPAGQQ